MRKRLLGLWCTLITLLLFTPNLCLAAAKKVDYIVIVADTRHFGGIMAWWANLYNESHVYFMLLTITIIPVTGVIFGIIADFVMNKIGIDLSSRELAEH